MSPIILFNKPFQVLSQFTDADARQTLKDFIDEPGYYACGRLDKDSEGLLILSNDGRIQHRISHPKHKLSKTYWVQIEGIPNPSSLDRLRQGIMMKDGLTRPAIVKTLQAPEIWQRTPAVRFRKTVADSWLEITINEGKNRQVRRMTAAIGHPTLRLIRSSIGEWQLDNLLPGEWCFA